jgi:YggT family protein
MGNNYLTDPATFLIQTLFGLYILIVLLRFILQWTHADFYNPISQFIVKATATPLRPLRRLIPGAGGIDLASLVLAWLLKSIELMLVLLLLGVGNPMGALLWSIPELINLLINIFLFAVLIQVILSWVNPGTPGAQNAARSVWTGSLANASDARPDTAEDAADTAAQSAYRLAFLGRRR